jgi:hypothetical protein
MLTAVFNAVIQFHQDVGADSILSACIFEFIPSSKLMSVSNDDSAFNTHGDFYNIVLSPNWGNRVDVDEYAANWVRKLVSELAELEKQDETISKDQQVVAVKAYFGGSQGDEKTVQVFGEEKMPKLRALKRKYDPEFVFHRWFPIVPAEA